MATKDTTGVSGGSGSSLTSASVTVGSNGNRILDIAVVLSSNTATVSSVTRNGQSATQIQRVALVDTSIEVWRIIAPTTGAATITASFSTSVGEAYVAWYSVYNVNQTTPSSATQTQSSASWITNSVSITGGSTNDLDVAFFGWSSSGGTASYGGGQTSEVNSISQYWRGAGITSLVATGVAIPEIPFRF